MLKRIHLLTLCSTAWVLLVMFSIGERATVLAAPEDTVPSAQGEASRDALLNSARWRRMRRSLDDWFSVQKIYTEAEVEAMKKNFEQNLKSMSFDDLEDFMLDTEDRLSVLMSDEAVDARAFLSHFTEEGRRRFLPDQPDVFGVSVSQLRQELRQFQQQRASRAAANAQANRLREQNVSANLQAQQARQQADLQARQERGAATIGGQQTTVPRVRSPYAPFQQRPPVLVSPWGGIWRTLP